MKAQKSLLTLGKHISAFKISGDLRRGSAANVYRRKMAKLQTPG